RVLPVATTRAGDAALPGTVRQRGRANAHGTHERPHVLRGRAFHRLREGFGHDVAIQRVAEHRAHEHRDRSVHVAIRISAPESAEVLDVQYERVTRQVWTLARGARGV